MTLLGESKPVVLMRRVVTLQQGRVGAPLWWLMWLSIGVALLPIAVAVIRAMTGDWLPIGDNGYFTIRSRDVFTEHHPLLGAWSSGSSAVETSVNNPGPLELDLLAPFTKVAPAAGTALGVGLVHGGAVAGIAYTLHRLCGPLHVIVAMVVTSSIAWSMGAAMLIEPRQHQYLVFVAMWFFVLTWAIAAGGQWALPWAAFTASLVLQTHLSYALLVGALTVWALGAFGYRSWRQRAALASAEWRDRRRDIVRASGVTGAVLVVCWAQPLYEQFFRDGNMSGLLTASGSGDAPAASTAVRVVASVLTTPPFWLRPAYRDFNPAQPVSAVGAVIGLAVLAVVLVTVAMRARRRRDEIGFIGLATVAVLLVAGLGTVMRLPVSRFGLTADNYRWLWPVAGVMVVAVVGGLLSGTAPAADGTPPSGLRHQPARDAPAGRRGATTVASVMCALAVVLAVASVPYSYQMTDERNGPRRIAVTAQLLPQLDDLGVVEPVLYDRSEAYFGEPFTYAVLMKLQDLGIEFVVPPGDNTRRFGPSRENAGDAEYVLSLRFGDAARATSGDDERVAFVPGLDDAEETTYHRLQDDLVAALQDGDLSVDIDRARAQHDYGFDAVASVLAGGDVDARFLPGDLVRLRESGALSGVDEQLELLERWLDLVDRRTFDTIALFLSPIE